MTVHAHDIALPGLGLQKLERFLSRIAMVKVHLMTGKSTTAVGTGNFAKLTQE
jgi:hypothetical protein